MNDKRSNSANRKRNQSEKYRYGNYNRYYGTRNKGLDRDPRLVLLPKKWFQDKSVLDIGCNVGHLTLSIAKEYMPSRILGIDIDEHLIGVARKNIRHYCKGNEVAGKFPTTLNRTSNTDSNPTKKRRIVFDEDGYEKPSCSSDMMEANKFPGNVWFFRENYVLDSDELLEMVKEEFDIILALSITKWIHLNWGDDGIKRFFKRAYKQLRPGGCFLLEYQEYRSYYKRAKMIPELMDNYKLIKLKPESFKEYLLSREIGFCEFVELGKPNASSKGYERPLWAFIKNHPKKYDESNGNGIFIREDGDLI